MNNRVTCSCGWSWNKSDSSKKDMYVCHQCGKDNTMKNGGWLNKYNDAPIAQNGIEGTMGGLTDKGFNYNGAWGGTMAMGGSLPGSVGFTYARTQSPAPSNGPYAKKTKASAQTGDSVVKTDTGGGPDDDYIKLDPTKFSQTTTTGVSEAFDPTNSKWKGQSTEWLQKRIKNAELLVQAIKDAKSLPKNEWEEKYKGASFAAVGEGRAQPILPDFYNDYKKKDDAFIQDWSQARSQAKNELLMQSRWTANKEKAKKEALDFLDQYKNQNEFLSSISTQAAEKYGYAPGELENFNAWDFLSNDAVSKAYQAINSNQGFTLPQDPTNEMTCANGVCTLQSMIGVDFSPLKGKKGVYYDKKTGYTIPQYNPTWLEDNNYEKVGYRKLDPREFPQPGDIAQYTDEGKARHMELVLDNLAKGKGLTVYNNYSQTNDNAPGEGKEVRGFRPGTYQPVDFEKTEYFRLTPEAQQKALSRNPTYLKKVEGKKAFESSEDYKKFMETQEYIKANQEKYNKFNQLNPQDWRNGGRTSAQNGDKVIKQDNTKVVQPVRKQPKLIIDPLTGKPATGERLNLLRASQNPKDQGVIKPYDEVQHYINNAIKIADVTTDLMQLGNFIPNPIGQTIGKFGNFLGAGIDAYQTYDELNSGNYGNALINAASLAIPFGLGTKSFRRNSKYLQKGQPLYPFSPQASGSLNRVNYIEPFTKVRGMTDNSLLANRGLLGVLGTETYLDTKENGGSITAQNGREMKYYQEGLDWKPKNISQDGSKTKKARQPKRVVVFAERPVIKSDPRASNEFVTEAQNVVNFYKRVSPSTKVEILPVYETGDNKTKQKIQDTLSGLSPDDDVMVFGHHGTKYAGIPTEQWASLLEDSNYGNCYLGSCQSEDVASRPWRNVRNLTYRPYSPWQGFNPKSDSVIDAMFSRGASYPAYNMQPVPLPENFSTGEEYMKAWNSYSKLVNEYNARESERPHKPNENSGDYSVKPNTPKWKKVNPFGNTNELNPFEYYQRQTGLPMSLAPPAKSKKEDGGWLNKYEEGGIIEDDMGQWAHPGEITKINSNQITMQGVDYPVLGISDTGDTQMMYPNQDYTYNGDSVTEIPMAQDGITRGGYDDPDYVTGTSRRAFNKMVGMGNYLVPANAINSAADLAKTKGLDYGAVTSGPADAVRHAAAAASVASRLPVPKFIGQYSPDLDRAIRIAGANLLGIGNEVMSLNPEGLLMDIKNNYQGSLIGSIPGLNDKARNKMIINQLQKGKLTVDNPKKPKKENGGWLNKYE